MKAQIDELRVEDVPAFHTLRNEPETAARLRTSPKKFELAEDLACDGAGDVRAGLNILQCSGGAFFIQADLGEVDLYRT